MALTPIEYREFWDRPRVFVVQSAPRWVLFDCPFDPDLDDYPRHYNVGLIEPAPELLDEGADWNDIHGRVVESLGQVEVDRVQFTRVDAGYGIDPAILSDLGL